MRSVVIRALGLLALAALLPACGAGSGNGTLTPTTAPGIPSSVTAVGGNGRVTLTWDSSGNSSAFTVSRSVNPGGPYAPLAGTFPTPTSFVDTGLVNGTDYYYIVTATNPFGTSPASDEVHGVPRFAALSVAPGSQSSHVLALFEDGTVWGWGINNFGEVGNGIRNYQSSPALAQGLPRVTAMARGDGFSLALAADGTLWSWGDNSAGALGRPAPGGFSLTPAPIPSLPPMAAVVAGPKHVLAVAQDGSVYGWGSNVFNEVGSNSGTLPVTAPVVVAGLPTITAVAAGASFSLALAANGTVWGWGYNSLGNMGLGFTSLNVLPPAQAKNLNGVVRIGAGNGYALALRIDGTLWGWGDNGAGQLGIGAASAAVTSPGPITTLQNVVSFATGNQHALAVKNDGTVWSWGSNENFGALGNGVQMGNVPTPTQVAGLTGMEQVFAGFGFSGCIADDGSMWTWGHNSQGQLGIGLGLQEPLPTLVNGLNQVTAVAAGGSHSLAIRNDGGVWAWGSNGNGQLGIGSTTPPVTDIPRHISTLANMTAIDAGLAHGIARRSDGTIHTWGYNLSGAIGNGSTANPVSTPYHVNVAGAQFTSVAAGTGHTLALRSTGTVYAWGANNLGQIGSGVTSASPTLTPFLNPTLTSIAAVSAGGSHNLALRNDGTVWAWGENFNGQVGVSPVSASVPTPQQVLTGIAAVAAGLSHSVALGTDGTVWTWGGNGTGELGTPPGANVTTPQQLTSLQNIVAVGAGSLFSVALRNDGTVWTWGYNGGSSLGDGTNVSRHAPAQVPGLGGITQISVSRSFVLTLRNDGLVWGWGDNLDSQLGKPCVQWTTRPGIITK